MNRLIDLETEQEFAELSEILSKVRHGHVVATLRQAVQKPDGDFSYVDLQKVVAETQCFLQVNSKYFYITIQNARRTDVRQIMTMWQTVLQRGTQRFQKNQGNDYLLVIDAVRDETEKGWVYCVTGVQPFMTGTDDGNFTMVFELEDIACAKDEVSIYDVEYEMAISESEGTAYVPPMDETEDEDDTSDAYSGESYLDTDKYL